MKIQVPGFYQNFKIFNSRWLWLTFLLLFWSSFSSVVHAQNKLWDKTFGGEGDDYLRIVQQTRDGGYIIGGYSASGISGDKSEVNQDKNNNIQVYGDYWLMKLKADGTKEWDKTFGGNNSDYLTSVQQTSDGGYILGGYSDSGKSGDKTQTNKGEKNEYDQYPFDYWIVKLTASGTKEWDKTFGGDDRDELASVQQTPDGGYILGGSSFSGISGDKTEDRKGEKDEFGQFPADYWIVKLKADGTKVWDKTIGGSDNDNLTSLLQIDNGGYILGGTSTSGISGDKTEVSRDVSNSIYKGDYWVVKLQADGSKVWDKTFGGDYPDILASLQQTHDGGYILGGSSSSGISGDKSQGHLGNVDYWLVKLKPDGTKAWDKSIGSDGTDNLSALQQTRDGGYILGGSSYARKSGDKTEDPIGGQYKGADDYWVVKLAADGTIAWDETIGGYYNNILQSLQQTHDGGYILGGYSNSDISDDKSQASKGQYDYWVMKLDERGKKKQGITFDPIPHKLLSDAPFSLSAKASSGLPVRYRIVSGPATVKDSTVTLTGLGTAIIKAFQAGNATYLPAEAIQTFVVEPASVAKKQWDKTIGGSGEDYLTVVQQTQDGGYILGGYSWSNISGEKTENARDIFDYWVVKLRPDGTKEWDKTFGGSGYEALRSLQQTHDGGYILGGISSSGIDGDKSEASKGGEDYWVVKLKADGTKEWDKTIGSSETDNLQSLQQTQDGGYILGGDSWPGVSGDKSEAKSGYWIVKLKANGTKEWDRTFGGNKSDILTSAQQTRDGGYILGGKSNSDISGDKSQARYGSCIVHGDCPNDYWIIKLKADGSKEWDKTIGSSEGDYLTALQQTHDGGYILGGFSNSNLGGDKTQANKGEKDIHGVYSNDYWIVKLKADGTKEWDQTIGGDGEDRLGSLQQTQDGGYILAGVSESGWTGDKTQVSRGEEDYWVVKLHPDGRKAWDKTFGGDRDDWSTFVQQTQDGSYIVGGTSRSDKSRDKSEEQRDSKDSYHYQKADYWVIKIKEEQPLTAQWDMRYGGSGTDNLTSVIKTSDGGYLSGGYSNSGSSGNKSQASQGQNDYWIVKSDKNGKKLWDKRYGGAADDYLNRVIQTQDGGYLLGGSSLLGISGDKTEASQGGRDYWVIKVDKQGNKEWNKTFGGSGYDELKKIIQLASGEYVLGGYSNSPVSGDKSQGSQGGNDYWLVKIRADGTKLWDKRYGGSQDETLGSFTQTRDGGFFLGGSSLSGKSGDKSQASQGGSDYWAVKTDKDGNLLWEKTYGGSGSDEVYSVRRSHGDNLYLAGTSDSDKGGDKSQESQGGKDYWLVKLDEKGNKLWDRTFGGSKADELRASTYTDEGHYFLAGHSYSGISGDKSQASHGASDYWVVQVNEKGEKVADQRFGGSGAEELRTVFQTQDGGLLLGGRSSSGVSGDRTQPSQGGTDYWLVKLAPLTSSMIATREATRVEELQTELSPLSAYPNPFSEQVTIRFTLPQTQAATVKMYDSQGREITTLFQGEAKAHQAYQVEWQAGNKAAGIYLLQLQTSTQRHQQKLLLAR